MSDILGSILQSMDRPPTISGHRQQMKEKLAQIQKQQGEEKAKLRTFRKAAETAVAKFIQNATEQRYKFKPMDKLHRSIVHDVAEIAGLSAFSFGEDEIDRYVMICKKECPPSDEELATYRRGEEWDPEKAKASAQLKEKEIVSEELPAKKPEALVPNCKYQEKYEKLLGKEIGKDGARIATPNKQFGFVPSDKKRDQRSIEQTLADIRAKKRKTSDTPQVEKT